MVKKVHVMLLFHCKVPKHLLSFLIYCSRTREAVPRWNNKSLQESDVNRWKVDLLNLTQKLPVVLRLAYKILRLRTQCTIIILLYSNYCEIVSAVRVAISCPWSPKHPLLLGPLDNIFPRALQQDHVNAEVWSFLRREETDPFVHFSSWFCYPTSLKSGTVMLVHLLPKEERGEGWIICVGEGFTDACLFLYWSLDCSQTVSPSTSPFPQWRLLLEPFSWSASWVHEQGISILC